MRDSKLALITPATLVSPKYVPLSSCHYLATQSITASYYLLVDSSTLAWKIPWTEEPGRLQSMGSLRVRHDWTTSLSLSLSCIGEGNGNPLQCSCLENPRDGEPGGLLSMGLHKVGHDWSDLAAAAALSVGEFPNSFSGHLRISIF